MKIIHILTVSMPLCTCLRSFSLEQAVAHHLSVQTKMRCKSGQKCHVTKNSNRTITQRCNFRFEGFFLPLYISKSPFMDSNLVLFDCTVFKTPFAHHSLQYFSVAHAADFTETSCNVYILEQCNYSYLWLQCNTARSISVQPMKDLSAALIQEV